jgi:hypothetical protein
MWLYKSLRMYKVHKTFKSGTTFHIKLYINKKVMCFLKTSLIHNEYISPLWGMHKLGGDEGSHVTALIREKRRALNMLYSGEINRSDTSFVLPSVITYITWFYRSFLVIRQHMITFAELSVLLKVDSNSENQNRHTKGLVEHIELIFRKVACLRYDVPSKVFFFNVVVCGHLKLKHFNSFGRKFISFRKEFFFSFFQTYPCI